MPNTRHPSLPRLRNLGLRLLVTMIAASSISTIAQTATATGLLPRWFPTAVPASFVVTSAEEWPRTSETGQYQALLRNRANTQAVRVVADPYDRESWERDVRSYRDAKVKSVIVSRGPAFILDESSGIRTLTWFDRDRIFLSFATGLDLATHRRVAQSVARTDITTSSFQMRSTPRGLNLVFVGPTSALSDGFSVVTLLAQPNKVLGVEVRRVDPRYVDVQYLNALAGTSTPITVNGKAGFRSLSVQGDTTLWYLVEPGVLVAFTSTTLSDAAIMEFAKSTARLPESSWTALQQQATDYSANMDVPREVVGAGVVDAQAWTAQVAARETCLVFTIALTPTQTCVTGPNMLGWSRTDVGGKPLAVGVAASNIATVVIKANGRELTRISVTPVINQPTLRLFVVAVPADADLTISGLDLNGTEIQTPLRPTESPWHIHT